MNVKNLEKDKIYERYQRTIQPAITKAVRNMKNVDFGLHISIFLFKDTGEVIVSEYLNSRDRIEFEENVIKIADVFTWSGGKKREQEIQEDIKYNGGNGLAFDYIIKNRRYFS